MALGRNIRALRLDRGWTLEDLERRSGVKGGTIGAMEMRDSKRSENAVQLAQAFGIDVEDLLTKDLTGATHIDAMTGEVIPKTGELTQSATKSSTRINQYDTGGTMGNHGLILKDQPGVIRGWDVSDEWIAKNVPSCTSVNNLAIVTGFGDSMRPLYNPGDPLLVDRGVKRVDFDGVYFFRIGDEGFIKRLQRVPGTGILAISENKAYRDWTITADMDFEVLARVLKAWSGENY